MELEKRNGRNQGSRYVRSKVLSTHTSYSLDSILLWFFNSTTTILSFLAIAIRHKKKKKTLQNAANHFVKHIFIEVK